MATQLIAGGRVATAAGGLAPGWVLVEDGSISEVGAGDPPERSEHAERTEAGGAWVVPGFVDIHCHGGGGAAFTDPAQVRHAVEAHRRHGTTTMLASLVSRPVAELVGRVAALREFVPGGLLAGIHLEGPFLSAARCGAHDPAVLRPPEAAAVHPLLPAGRGAPGMVTIAPGLDGAVPAVKRVVDAGVLAAVGHTDALAEDVVP